jgi:hypothetical protein
MDGLLVWMEDSALGQAMRQSGVWTYGLVNLAHILGIGALFGAVLVLDLRLLGLWRRVPLAAIARPTVPVATAGFLVAAASGICLIATNATDYIGNPFMQVKFPAIALGVLNVGALHLSPAWRDRMTREPLPRERSRLALAGGVSLACWLTAIGTGRMVGYW